MGREEEETEKAPQAGAGFPCGEANRESASAEWAAMLVSTTITNNAEKIIGDALRSVVDKAHLCLVVDTGVTDRSLEIAREVCGEKLRVASFRWTGSFADARNFALEEAARLATPDGFAITVDSDERIHLAWDGSCADVLLMKDELGTYSKDRIFRLPARGRWVGPVHESFIRSPDATIQTQGLSHFVELPKTPDQLKKKFELVLAALEPYVLAHPTDPRWHYYLADAYAELGRAEEAVASFDTCASLRGWDEEAAWACYRAGELLCKENRFDEAITRTAAGLCLRPDVAELAWLAAWASFHAGRLPHAVAWARMSASIGEYHRGPSSRIGFRHPAALHEGPYDILRFALAKLGDKPGADAANTMYLDAKNRREEGLRESKRRGRAARSREEAKSVAELKMPRQMGPVVHGVRVISVTAQTSRVAPSKLNPNGVQTKVQFQWLALDASGNPLGQPNVGEAPPGPEAIALLCSFMGDPLGVAEMLLLKSLEPEVIAATQLPSAETNGAIERSTEPTPNT